MPGLETTFKKINPKTNPLKPVWYNSVCHLWATSEKAPCCNLIPLNLLGFSNYTSTHDQKSRDSLSQKPGPAPLHSPVITKHGWKLNLWEKFKSKGKSRRKCLTPTECLYSPSLYPTQQRLGKAEQSEAIPLAQWRPWDRRKVIWGIPTGKACALPLQETGLSNSQTMAAIQD